MTYWHGGKRPPDGVLRPQALARYGGPGDGWVYVTTDRGLAMTYAATLPGSWVMEVLPVGEVEVDPDSILGTSFRCREARVVRSYTVPNVERAARQASVRRVMRWD